MKGSQNLLHIFLVVDNANLSRNQSFSSFFFNILYFVAVFDGLAIQAGYVYKDVFASFIVGDKTKTF